MKEADTYEVLSLGIDQGIANIGYAITGFKRGEEFILHSGTFKTTTKHEFANRLEMIYTFINDLLDTYNVKVIGMEKLFFNPVQGKGRNKSADIMRTNMVTGLVFLTASQHRKVIWDYTPGTVKKYVAGHGHAPKEMVLAHVEGLASRSGIVIKTEHEADAIAISLTALKQYLESLLGGDIKAGKTSKGRKKSGARKEKETFPLLKVIIRQNPIARRTKTNKGVEKHGE